MKIRSVLITAVILTGLGAGTSYAVRMAGKRNEIKVEVIPVIDVNSESYGMDEETVSGTIISKDTQIVTVDTNHEIKEVYVKVGDKVKKGDKLIEYDMLADELKAEMEELTKMGLELNLNAMKKDLETLKSGRIPEDSADEFDFSDEDDYVDGDDAGLDEEDEELIGAADTASSEPDRGGQTDEFADKAAQAGGDGTGTDIEEASSMSAAAVSAAEDENSEAGSSGEAASSDETEADITGQDPDAGIVQNTDEELVETEGIVDAQEETVDQPDAILSESEEYVDGIVTDEEISDVLDESTSLTDGTPDAIMVGDDSEIIGSVIPSVNSFLQDVNEITSFMDSDWENIYSEIDAVNTAIATYENSFATSTAKTVTNLLGESVSIPEYEITENVSEQVGEATSSVLETAYERLCVYRFIYAMLTLNPGKTSSELLDDSWLVSNETLIRSAVDAFEKMPDGVWLNSSRDMSGYEFSSKYGVLNNINTVFSSEDTMMGFLLNVTERLAGAKTSEAASLIEQDTTQPDQVSTEGKKKNLDDFDYDDDYDDDTGDDGYYTAEEMANAIKSQEKAIREIELQIRESELSIKEYKHVLDGRIVYAQMDGIVKSVGEGDAYSDSYLMITGRAGLYVKGTVSELNLATLKVGDFITGTSYETGGTFTAEITEISEFPASGDDAMYGMGDGSSNASYYPFLAYIEDADGLEVDSYVDLSLSNSRADDSGDMFGETLSLDEFYVRTDENGRSYCFVRGEDGLLEKRYLEIGANNWGVITIKSGLKQDDYIAFPYGDGVVEGAKTVKVESLTAVDGESY